MINKRAGGMGLISGRKAFQRPMKEGVGVAERDSGRLSGQGHHGRVTPRARRWLVIAGAAAVVALGVPLLFRPGYSPDEEFTVFAVRGIRAHGLPLLPSGLLYDRGLLYSYAAWLAATVTGLELPAFRGLSLLCGAGVLGLGYALVGGAVSPAAGAAAAVFVAGSLPFWAAATTGRFYAPFLLTCVAVLAAVARLPGVDGPHRSALVAPGSGPGGTSRRWRYEGTWPRLFPAGSHWRPWHFCRGSRTNSLSR